MAAGTMDLLGTPVEPAEATRAKRGSIPVWVERYGYGARQIKNWLADGRTANDLPPLDRPAEMPEWFVRIYSKKAPERLLAAVGKLSGGNQQGSGESQAAAIDLNPFVMPTVHEDDLGIEAQLKSYQREWAILGKLRTEALMAKQFNQATSYFNQQKDLSGEIRQLEKLLPTVLEQRGDFQRTSEVRRATMDLLKILKSALDSHGPKCATRLRAAGTDTEFTVAWRDEMDRVFARCCENRFAEEFELA